MEPEQNTTPSHTPEEPTGQEPTREDKPAYEPYKKSTRIKAWLGVAFMVFLVIMYTYAFASGKILLF